MTLPENLRRIRKARSMTQTELAERVGVLQKDISRYERGQHVPSIQMLKDIAEVLGVTVNDLIEENNDE